ncbi:MAG: Clp protease ClpP [Eubacteriales bacterium]|nr:Clp protease ClpP [Eubacteriales bacterium]
MIRPFGRKPDPVNIQRDCYAMALKEGNHAEITMYGQIVERRPTDWWTGEPIDGNFIVKSEFLDDLDAIKGARKLTIRLDSLGGDAYASLLIYNRLRELKAKKTVQVDGAAMSGGSVIMCAGDTVKVNPGSLIMVHQCASFLYGYYNGDALEKARQSNAAVDKALASVYAKKTGMDETEALEMMQQETYLTGEEALAKGFADELLENEDAPEIAASADHSTLFVNGRALATLGYPLPGGIPVAPDVKASVSTTQEPTEESGEGGQEIMAKTFEELKAQNPDLAERVEAEIRADLDGLVQKAVADERQRLADIDSIAGIYSGELVHEAKYGEPPCTAQELAFRAAQEAARRGKEALTDMEQDAQASGAKEIGAAPAPEETTELSPEERRAAGRSDAQALKKE